MLNRSESAEAETLDWADRRDFSELDTRLAAEVFRTENKSTATQGGDRAADLKTAINGNPVDEDLQDAVRRSTYGSGIPLSVGMILQDFGVTKETACNLEAAIKSRCKRDEFSECIERIAAYNALPEESRRALAPGGPGRIDPVDFAKSLAGTEGSNPALASLIHTGGHQLDAALREIARKDPEAAKALIRSHTDRAISSFRNAGLGNLADALVMAERPGAPADTATDTPDEAYERRRSPVVRVVEQVRDSIVTLERAPRPPATGTTSGSGVIVDSSGYIVTNQHVTNGHRTLTTVLRDGTRLQGEVVYEDRDTDLALIRVRPERPLPELRLGPSADAQQGESTIAIGAPYGYQNSVTTGIVSHTNRSITMPTGAVITGLLQTDSAINPGNSGGALLNINGELIGINCALREGSNNIAFAMNSDSIQRQLASALSAERHAGLSHGIQGRETVGRRASERQRFVVGTVAANSPAHQAGLRTGDIVLSIAGRNVSNRFDVERAFWSAQAGRDVAVQIQRGQERMTLQVRPRSVR